MTVGLIVVVSCSFILGNREGLPDKKVFEQRPAGSEEADLGQEFQVEGTASAETLRSGVLKVQQGGQSHAGRVRGGATGNNFRDSHRPAWGFPPLFLLFLKILVAV